MRYLGGKSRTANQISGYLNVIRQPGQPYWEPFVGAGWVLAKIRGGDIYASDANPALIAMWQALQAGWEPPAVVTEEMHKAAKRGEYEPHLEAFIRFGCSFGGDWNGGYARGNTSPQMVKNSLMRKLRMDAQFFHADFITCPAPAPACLIYCDPPYDDTTGYGNVPPWNPQAFWQRVRELEGEGHTVVVSEYKAPTGFDCVVRMPTKTEIRTQNGRELRIERLFRYGNHKPLQPQLFNVAQHVANVAPETPAA